MKFLCCSVIVLVSSILHLSQAQVDCSQTYQDNPYNYFLANKIVKCFKQNTYDTTLLPINDNATLSQFQIFYAISMVDLIDFTIDGQFTFMSQLYLSWVDQMRYWSKSITPIDSVTIQMTDIWYPTFTLLNSINKDSYTLSAPDKMTAAYHYNGQVEMFLYQILQGKCGVNLIYFPFDTQTCNIFFVLNNYYNSSQVTVNKNPYDYSNPAVHFENELFSATKVKSDVIYYPLYRSEVLPNGTVLNQTLQDKWQQGFKLTLTLERNSNYYQFSLLIPIYILNVIVISVVFLPVESDKRVDVAITAVLGYMLVLILITTVIPISKTIPLLTIIVTCLLGLATYNTIMVIIILALYNKGEKARKHNESVNGKDGKLEMNYKNLLQYDDEKLTQTEQELGLNEKIELKTTEGLNSEQVSELILAKRRLRIAKEWQIKADNELNRHSPLNWCKLFGWPFGGLFLKYLLCNFCGACWRTSTETKLEVDANFEGEKALKLENLEPEPIKPYWYNLYSNLCCCLFRKGRRTLRKTKDSNRVIDSTLQHTNDRFCCCAVPKASKENNVNEEDDKFCWGYINEEDAWCGCYTTKIVDPNQNEQTEGTKTQTKNGSEHVHLHQVAPSTTEANAKQTTDGQLNASNSSGGKKIVKRKKVRLTHPSTWKGTAKGLNIVWAISSLLIFIIIIVGTVVVVKFQLLDASTY